MLLVLIPTGFLLKLYKGPGDTFLNNKFADFIYVVFWTFAVAAVFIRSKPLPLVLVVFGVTCGLEFLQLHTSPFLEWIRASFLGRALIGNSFAPDDFIYYTLAALASWFWLRKIDRNYLDSGI